MSSLVKSLIWIYFSRGSSHGKRATCNICKKTYSRAGSSTTLFVNHLRSIHNKAYQEYKSISEEAEQISIAVKPSSEMALAKFETKKQMTLEKTIGNNLHWDNSDEKSI